MPGIGGTGVVTVSAVLQMAAHLQGRQVAGLEQIGLAQKGGPVISDLRIESAPIRGQLRATRGAVDVLLGFDLLGCVAEDTLSALDPNRSVAVLNTEIAPTASMVTDPRLQPPSGVMLTGRVARATRAAELLSVEADTIAHRLFGDHMPANMVVVGAAYQHGCLPLGAHAIERAIELNGAAVEANVAAFRWGRAVVANPAALEAALGRAEGQRRVQKPLPPGVADVLHAADLPAGVRELALARTCELLAYQNARYAARYADEVARVAAVERRRSADEELPITAAYAAGLFKLMAYKDEYEVARLHLDPAERDRLAAEFGPDARLQVLLHPPALRAVGVKRKLRFGRSAPLLFRCLRAARRLRGTPLDPFGGAEVRRVERRLIDEYCTYVASALDLLDGERAQVIRQIAELPDLVRGYEHIKLANVHLMHRRARALLDQLSETASTIP
jgi:indolepyruvate ferredoxin oxidoreductase